jgi:hypothetical protein
MGSRYRRVVDVLNEGGSVTDMQTPSLAEGRPSCGLFNTTSSVQIPRPSLVWLGRRLTERSRSFPCHLSLDILRRHSLHRQGRQTVLRPILIFVSAAVAPCHQSKIPIPLVHLHPAPTRGQANLPPWDGQDGILLDLRCRMVDTTVVDD